MEKANHVHDRFFKQIFSHVSNTRDFVQLSFPPDMVQKMDLTSLSLDEKSYITAQVDESFSDLVYSCNYKVKKLIKICLLFEHKSRQSPTDVFQILSYMTNAYMQAIKQKKRQEIVIPIVFYHGQKPWKKKAFHKYFGETDAILRKFIPAFDYILIDLSQFTDTQIEEIYQQKDILRTSLYLFKYIQNRQEIINKIEKIFNFAESLFEDNENENQLKSIYIYLFNNLNEEEAMTTITKLKKTTVRKSKGFVSYADTLIMRGREKGMEEGMEKGETIKSLKTC